MKNIIKITAWMFMLFAYPLASHAGCGQTLGRCTYIHPSGEVKVSNEVCSLASCGNVSSTVTAMEFQNGAGVSLNIELKENGDTETTLNGEEGVNVMPSKGEFSLHARSKRGEVFISRLCNEEDAGCEGKYYPEFWGDFVLPYEVEEIRKTTVFNGYPLVYVGEIDEMAVLFQEYADENDVEKVHVVARGDDVTSLKIANPIDLDGDETDELVIEKTSKGQTGEVIRIYEFFMQSDEGLFKKIEGDGIALNTGDGLKWDADEKTIGFTLTNVGESDAELLTLTKKAKYLNSRIVIVDVQEQPRNISQ